MPDVAESSSVVSATSPATGASSPRVELGLTAGDKDVAERDAAVVLTEAEQIKLIRA
ncbi:MAG: hypothetical protein HY938_02775 [Nitrosomonadales bacterium]|nr:hypothetical protein [Nitrosomonadales bacterium]